VSHAARAVVVIPTSVAGPPLAAALEAMGPAWRAACVIADNGAPASEVAAVAERFPEPEILALGANHGFARAVNAGIAHGARAGTEFAVVLNDDVTAGPEALDALVAALAGCAGAGSAAGVLLQGDTPRVDTAGIRCDAGLASRDVGRDGTLAGLAACRPPLGPSGGLAAYRLAALAQVGGFDEGFFAYYEDVDLALRLRAAGWGCVLAATAVGRHLGSATLGWRSVEKAVAVGRSRGRIARKYAAHRRRAAWPALALELAAGAALGLELRSMAPLTARVAGFATASAELPYPTGLVDRGGARDAIRRLARRYRAAPTGTAPST
jgi:GT2 family glycosyltransferase